MRIYLVLILLSSNILLSNAQKNKHLNWSFKTNDKVLSHPTVDNGIVYFGSNDKIFYAKDAQTGGEIWSYKTNYSIRSKALIYENLVYFKSGNQVYALNKKTGKKLWVYSDSNTKGAENLDFWDYHSGDPIIYNLTIYFGFGNGNLCGFDLLNGKLKMQFATIDTAAVKSTPVVKNSIIYFGDWKGKIYAYDLNAYDTLWTYQTYKKKLYSTFGQVNTEFFIYDTLLVFGARNPEMQVLNINTGKPVWNFIEKNGGWISGDPIVVNDTLYIGGSDNHKMIAFNIYTGQKYWEYEFLFNNFSKPLIYKDYILFTTGDAYSVYGSGSGHGYLYALNRIDGTIKNFELIGGNIYSSPILDNNNIFLSSEDNGLYVIDLKSFLYNSQDLDKTGYKSVDIIKISPNPFKDKVKIDYKVNYDATISVKIIDLNGKEINNLFSGKKAKGNYSILWNGKDNIGKTMTKGYYFIEISSAEYYKNIFLQKSK